MPDQENFTGGSDVLIESLYRELKVIARREHFRAGAPQTLQPTALINEAYVKLSKHDGFVSHRHFLACAATAIRHILIDAARARIAGKRGGTKVSFTESLDSMAAMVPDDADVMRLGDALKALSNVDPNLALLVDCRFFAGLDEQETADVLDVSVRTVRRWWVQARAWIHHEMAA
ncbi:RNA polymerase sigma factor (TIGR02999 family) [Sphingomonas sp. UYAg733]